MKNRIIQFHSGASYGDAITNAMFSIDELFKKHGHSSYIFSRYIDPKVASRVNSIDHLSVGKDDLLIIHHSSFNPDFSKIINLKCKKILIYHNITPVKYFNDYQTRSLISKAYSQVKDYKNYIDVAIAVSNYNRKQLLSFGYKNVYVIPLFFSLQKYRNVSVKIKKEKIVKFLFVGRIVRNKKQDDIIKVFNIYTQYFNNNSKLFLVGKVDDERYYNELLNYIDSNLLREKVIFTGKVNDDILNDIYSETDILLCMSEHEGVGVPLLEGMAYGIPIVSINSSAISETLNGNGILFNEKKLNYFAAVCDEIINNNELRENLSRSEKEYFNSIINLDLYNLLLEGFDLNRKETIQIEGPFETSYSLAKVNRSLAIALDKIQSKYSISLFPTEGDGDYIPKRKNLEIYDGIKKLYLKSKSVVYPDITIRNVYPPRVFDARGGLNFLNYAIEESYIPSEYIDDFNKYLDGIGTSSQFVTDTLLENGLKIPVKTIGNGVDLVKNFDSLKKFPLKTKKRIKFLHISSAFPRKGVDVLLNAYYKTFTYKDDVCLILKTFPNIHNKTEELIKNLNEKYINSPEIEFINCDLNEEEINSLYKSVTYYIHCARGEGFGLPVAEAMLAKLPTIVCNNSGLNDFVNENTSICIKSNKSISKSHICGNNLSYWYEPDIEDLCKKMKNLYLNPDNFNIKKLVDNAYKNIRDNYSWDSIAEKWNVFISEIKDSKEKIDVSMITTWNMKCGIAEHSKFLVENSPLVNFHIYPNYSKKTILEDQDFVENRYWKDDSIKNLNILTEKLLSDFPKIVHFQFNWGFFDVNALGKSINDLSKSKKIVITFHSTSDNKKSLKSIVSSLNSCSALIVHQKKDFQNLINLGIKKELINLIPVGQVSSLKFNSFYIKQHLNLNDKYVVGTFGFFLEHKGIMDVIKSIEILKNSIPNIYFLCVCSIFDCRESKDYLNFCQEYIKNKKLEKYIRLITDFLPIDESLKYLSCCNLLIAPYHKTNESASGAVHFLFPPEKPVITTNINIFNEFKEYTYQIAPESIDSIVESIKLFFNDSKLYDLYCGKCKNYLSINSWKERANREYEIYKKLI